VRCRSRSSREEHGCFLQPFANSVQLNSDSVGADFPETKETATKRDQVVMVNFPCLNFRMRTDENLGNPIRVSMSQRDYSMKEGTDRSIPSFTIAALVP